ncbi:MAG TPA: small ribosomal subunit Rsm22 family protein, partial [Limnochordia bacterium]|nr:small ribosomal subunit Rsm22 family protein [Limnochordia bacterium]
WVAADLAAGSSPFQTTAERTADGAGEPHDLVTCSYMIGELPDAHRLDLVRTLWSITVDTLVLIEPGTPAGAARIAQARSELLARGGHTIAPCPHDLACPLAADDWCHFAQRVARSRLHRLVKASELPYEDEKFSFAALAKAPQPVAHYARVIRHPQSRKGHIRLELCKPEGLASEVVSRKEKARFRFARDARWGSTLPLGPPGRS